MPELVFVPAALWTALTFVAVLAAVVLDGLIADPLRLAPAIGLGIGALPIGWMVQSLRSPATLEISATPDGLTLHARGKVFAARRVAENWPPAAGLTWREGTLSIPWTHSVFAKLRAPQVAHFLDGRLRFGRALVIDAWAPPDEGLRFLTRCRVLCLRRLGDEVGVHREIARLERTDGERAEPRVTTQTQASIRPT
jgi:hypothetical protein